MGFQYHPSKQSDCYSCNIFTITPFFSFISNSSVDSSKIHHFTKQTIFHFANETLALPSNTIKLNLNIQDWPFRSLQNNLAITYNSVGSNQQPPCVSSQLDASGSLRWFIFTFSGVEMYLNKKLFFQIFENIYVENIEGMDSFSKKH